VVARVSYRRVGDGRMEAAEEEEKDARRRRDCRCRASRIFARGCQGRRPEVACDGEARRGAQESRQRRALRLEQAILCAARITSHVGMHHNGESAEAGTKGFGHQNPSSTR
jgi:hypothetical protein